MGGIYYTNKHANLTWVIVVQSANAYKHIATVRLQILRCGFLSGLSIQSLSVSLSLTQPKTLTTLVKTSCACLVSFECETWCMWGWWRRKKQHHHEVMYSDLVLCGAKFLFSPLWWKTETGSVLYRQIHADTPVVK